jgi:hypothetical protein
MSAMAQLRRLVAIRYPWVIATLGVAAILFSPFAAVQTSASSGVTLLIVGGIAVAVSIEMARSLDIQRKVRNLGAAQAVMAAKQREPASVPSSHSEAKAPQKELAVARSGTDVTPGRLISGHGVEHLPVIAFDLTGMDEEQISCAVDSIAAHQLIAASFKPLFLIDRPEFGTIRSYGYLAELLIAHDEWRNDSGDRIDYVRSRLDSIERDYACAAVVRGDAQGLGEIGTLLIERIVTGWAKRR